MAATEKYLFDSQGYLVVPNALAPGQVAALNQLIDGKLATHPEPGKSTYRFGNTLGWGPPYAISSLTRRFSPTFTR